MINFIKSAALIAVVITSISCSAPKEAPKPKPFDASNSDPAAVELVDSVIAASGGNDAWDKARYFSWTSSSGRMVYWDKQQWKVRMESGTEVYLLNLADTTVRIKDQSNTTEADASKALSLFNEDAQELVLPFLLKQFGSKLVYLGEDSLSDGTLVNVLNYLPSEDTSSALSVKIGVKDKLIKQVVKNGNGESAESSGTWDSYKNYNDLLLSVERTGGKGPKNLKLDPIETDKFENF